MPALHLPAQSGSDAVLKAMNRRYTSAHYLQLIDKLRDACPDIALSTDIIVGFPGETEQDFEDTARLVDTVGYHQVFTFIYSKREGTPAAKMPDQIDEDVKNRRLDQLMMMQQAISAELLQNRIGEVCEVLVEGRDEDGFYGRSLREAPESDGCIHLVGDDYQIGSYVPIRIISADAYDLRAERAPSYCIPFHSVGSADSQLLPRYFAAVGQNDRRETTFFCPYIQGRKTALLQRSMSFSPSVGFADSSL